tara:strand:+ start:1025 stop:1402 length:378 start_codon:yes stop_codon:yes gene_type:complete
MISFFINPKEKSISEVLLSKESEDNIYLVKIWDTIRLLLETEFVDGMPYDEDGYIFYRQQDYSSGSDGKHWIKVKGIDKTKIVFGNSLLVFPNLSKNAIDLLQTTIYYKITFLDDYKIPTQDFEL